MTSTKTSTWTNRRGLLLKKKEVCKLLYSLKQAFKQWYKNFDEIKLLNEFIINEIDKYIYLKNINKCYIIVYLYMYGVLILEIMITW
jgi:hypothetical protein